MADWKTEIMRRLQGLNLAPVRSAEIVEEVAQHLEDRYQECLRASGDLEGARRATLAELSDGELLGKRIRKIEAQVPFEPIVLGGGRSMGSLATSVAKDLGYAVRMLRANPSFAAIAILSLALGIGANTAIFQLLDAVRLRTLPVASPQELAEVKIADRKWGSGMFHGEHPEVSVPLWEQIRDHQTAFSDIFAWSVDDFNLTAGGEARYARGLWVSGGFFNVLRVGPLLGRLLTKADDLPGCGTSSAVISYAFWQREFGGDAATIEKKLSLNNHPFEIVGVTPPNFTGVEVGKGFDVAIPLCSEPAVRGEDSEFKRGDAFWLATMGRLKPGMTLAQASAQMKTVSLAWFQQTIPPVYDADSIKKYLEYRLGAFPADTGFSELRENYETPLWMMLALAGMVLLIACANLANLLLARATARQKEIAVRLALGASRRRLIQQLLIESLMMALIGAALGALLAQILSRSLVALLSTQKNPLFVDLRFDWHMLLFTTALAVVTCILFGLAPALRATLISPREAMNASSRGMTANRDRFGLRRLLVVMQVCFSLVLLVGALLFARSLHNLLTVDPGFQQDGILVTSLDLTPLNVPKERRAAVRQQLIDRIKSIPGVDGAAETTIVPLGGRAMNTGVMFDKKNAGQANLAEISSGYFKTLGTQMLAGRDFSDRDNATSPKVAIVTEEFSRKFLNGANPVGTTFHLEVDVGDPDPTYEVVGLVKSTKYQKLREDYIPIAYFPTMQADHPGQKAKIMVRSNIDMAGLMASIKRRVDEYSPAIVINFNIFKSVIAGGLLRDRLMAILSEMFGLLAGVLATIGLYGVMSYMVVMRRNEIGIRMALGANRLHVVKMILREALTLLVAGVGLGTLISLFAGKATASMLYGLKPTDPFTLAMAGMLLGLVALAASFVPAQRAASVDPMIALRDE